MQQSKRKQQEVVHIVTHKVTMRFTPITIVQCAVCVSERPKWQRLMMPSLNYLWSKLRLKPKRAHQSIESRLSTQSITKQEDKDEHIVTEVSIVESETNVSTAKHNRLTFALRLSTDHFLIGNHQQLDIIQINSVNNRGFVDPEYLWSIRRKDNITHACIEQKKFSMLVIVAQTETVIYTFDPKKFPTTPLQPTSIIPLESEPVFVHIVREGNISFFFKDHLEVFLAGQNFRRRYNRKYQLPQIADSTFQLFFVPYNFENHVSVFFEEKLKKNKNIFALWSMDLEYTPSQIKNHPLQKIYQIKSSLRDSISINNYSKQIFLLNLGSEILALKRGYVLDSATVSLKREQSQLEYVGNDILLHISHKKIEVYNFSINLNTKPFKIIVKSKDSIKIHGVHENEQFFKAMPILNNDYLIIFQDKRSKNILKNGELHYSFYVTRGLSRDQKMLQLFPKNVRTFKTQDPQFLENCDMAVKMGFSIKQIYLQLWSRSYQNSKEDYDLLIATNDYTTISDQIIRKLKKMSVNYTQIEYIEKQCLKMLHFRVFSPKCTFEGVMNYMSCHFFKRKLEMFYEMDFMERGSKEREEKSEKLKMTIREYQFYKNMQIKTQLIQYVNLFCHENKKQAAKNIRFLLKSFKFAFRIIYETILEEIIKNAKDKLLSLLRQIPEILPFEPEQMDRPVHIPVGLYHGVWPEISIQQWKNSLFVDAITTIDNKEVILEEVVKSIAFKRNWLSHHDMITLSIENIKKNQESIRSPRTFYFFIAKLFDHIKSEQVLKGIVDFIEEKYSNEAVCMRKSIRSGFSQNSNLRGSSRSATRNEPKIVAMPENIKGKVFLLEKIYRFFLCKNMVPLRSGKSCSLSQFFQFEDPQLIKHCFDKQRSRKGLLLKDIKQIYMACLKNHHEIFNKALLNYFVSDLSQISDLKYLLNRINNEKQQFHRENRDMYPVLIQALERKMMIGTGKDIPIDQVLIYLENIPLYASIPQDGPSLDVKIMGMLGGLIENPTLSELHAVQRVNKESNYLRECRVNMTIYDILHNPEDVFTRLVEHILQNSHQRDWETMQAFKQFSIHKISQIEQFASIVYINQEHNLNYEKTILFIYLAKLCEELPNIKYANYLLRQEEILKHYYDFSAEGLVQFMYKWKMVQQNSYILNEQYISELLQLLPEDSSTRIFIDNELQFAKMLSCSYLQVTFPISDSIINYEDIKHYVHRLGIEQVMEISIDRVYEVVRNIQDIISEEIEQQQQPAQEQISMDPQSKVTRYQVYQIFIVKYLKDNKIKEVLPLIKTLMSLEKSDRRSNYDIVFPILYILHIVGELNESNKDNLVQCIWYYFYSPQELLQKLEHIVNQPLSPHELKNYIERSLSEGKNKYLGFNPQNPLFNSLYTSIIGSSKAYERKFMEMLLKVTKHIQESKEEFKAIKYYIIVAMLCNQPYALAKFIHCSDEKNVKPIRSILSFAILEDVFEPFSLLQIGRRVFMVLLETLNRQYPIDVVIEQFKQIELCNDVFIEDYVPPEEDSTFQSIMWKSAEAFRRKKKFLMDDQKSGSKIFKNNNNLQEKRQKILKLFENEEELMQKQQSEYIFSDSDNQEEMEMQIRESGLRKSKGRMEAKFIAKNQRQAIIESIRIKKPCALYKSTQGFGLRKVNRLYVSTSNHPSMGSSNLKVDKPKNKSTNRISSQNMGILTLKMNYSEQYRDEQQSKSAGRLEMDSDGRSQNVAKSSPQIDPFIHPNLMQIQSMESAEFDQEPLVTRSQDYDNLIKPIIIQSPREEEEDHEQQMMETSENDKPTIYHIKVNEVTELSEDEFENEQSIHMQISDEIENRKKQESQKNKQANAGQKSNTSLNLSLESVGNRLIKDNQNIEHIYADEFNLTSIDGITDEAEIIQVMKIMYNKCVDLSKLPLVLKIMGKIIQARHPKGLQSEIFEQIIKIQQVQQKMLPQVHFSSLFPSSALLRAYATSEDLFIEVYTSLRRFIGSENIYTISQFIRRVFDNPQFEQQIIWDFTLDLCEKIQGNALQERQWNLEKIQATLPKVEVAVWNKSFDSFKKKVLEPDCRDELLEIFCQAIKSRKETVEAITFLENVQNVYNCEKVAETLQILQKQ